MENKSGPKPTSSNNDKPKQKTTPVEPQGWDFMKKYETKEAPKPKAPVTSNGQKQ